MRIKVLLLAIALLATQCKNKKDNQVVSVGDSTFTGFNELVKSDTAVRNAVDATNIRVLNFITGNHAIGTIGIFSSVITIPVVVHVVYNNTAENISDAAIQDQIAALNRDFRQLNAAEIAALPLAFRNISTDTRIEFKLAQRKPDCTATASLLGAIERTSTTATDFNATPLSPSKQIRNPMKFSSTLGANGWDANKYLNIWVCDLQSGVGSGYASLPALLTSLTDEDGIVVDYEYFGNGISQPNRNLGRTCTKLVGQWLGLVNIWGTNTSGCSDSDFAAPAFDDTPNQDDQTAGCPVGMQTSCLGIPTGDNYQNFMDETNDACRVMFTCGQADVMNAILATTRLGIINSNALVAPVVPAQLWLKDAPEDTGDEAINPSPVLYLSDDIWVRNANDGVMNQEHQNAKSNSLNYVYVRVRNRGCATAAATAVKLYWAKASGSLSWPSPWDGTVTVPALMGGSVIPVGTRNTGSISAGNSEILTFQWNTPDLAPYASFGADAGHFCLLAEVQNNATSSVLVDHPGNLWDYVKYNREVCWKNIGVSAAGGTSMAPAMAPFSSMLTGNFTQKPVESKYEFKNILNESSVFDFGKVYIKGKMVKKWKDSDQQGNGVRLEGDSIIIEKPGAYITGINFTPNEFLSIEIGYDQKPDASSQRKIYKLNVEESQKTDNEYRVTGGQVFVIKDEFDPAPQRPGDGGTGGNGNDKGNGQFAGWWKYLAALVLVILGYFLLRPKK